MPYAAAAFPTAGTRLSTRWIGARELMRLRNKAFRVQANLRGGLPWRHVQP